MSRVQDDEVGDGTTSVTVLAAELLRVRLSEQVWLHFINCFFTTVVLNVRNNQVLPTIFTIDKYFPLFIYRKQNL